MAILNMVGGGGGGLQATDAILRVIAPAGSTVTISKGGVSKSDAGHENAADNTLYDYYFIIHQSQLDNVNPWTVTATLDGDSASDTVIIDSADEYDVELSFGTLYSPGDSSGWTSMAWSSASGRTAHAPTISYGPTSMDLLQDANHSGIVYHDPVDLTNFSTLIAKGSFTGHSVADNGLYVFSSLSGTYYDSSYVSKDSLSHADATDTQFEIDVSSLTGEYYVAFGLARNSGINAEFVVSEVYLQ